MQMLILAAVSVLAVIVSDRANSKSSDNIATIDPPNSVRTYPQGISTISGIAGYYYDSNGVSHSFIQKNDGSFVSFDPVGAIYSQAYSINDSGIAVGSYTDSEHVDHSYIRYPSGVMENIDPVGAKYSVAHHINPSGVVSGVFGNASVLEAGFVRNTDKTVVRFFAPDGTSQITEALVSDTGGISGGILQKKPQSFAVSEGYAMSSAQAAVNVFQETTPIPQVFDSGTWVFGGNGKGDVVGYYVGGKSAQRRRGFMRMSNGSVIFLDVTQANPGETIPAAVNDSGVVAGYYFDQGLSRYAGFVRRDPSCDIVTFSVNGALNTIVAGIGADGSIIGYYIDSQNRTHGFKRTSFGPCSGRSSAANGH